MTPSARKAHRLAETQIDAFDLRRVLGHFATGIAIVTALHEGRPVGMTVQSFASLSLSPPLVLLCPSRDSVSWPSIASAGHLCINLLADHQEALARSFARTGTDKFKDVAWESSEVSGSPVLPGSLAWLDCRLKNVYEEGDHFIAICEVRMLRASAEAAPLVFFRSEFKRMRE